MTDYCLKLSVIEVRLRVVKLKMITVFTWVKCYNYSPLLIKRNGMFFQLIGTVLNVDNDNIWQRLCHIINKYLLGKEAEASPST